MASQLMSVVVISIVTTDGDHPERRQYLAEWLASQLREMERRGFLLNGLPDEAVENTAISIGTGVKQAGGA